MGMTMAGLMEKVSDFVAVALFLSVTLAVMIVSPDAVGVPLSTPADERLIPLGSVPVYDQGTTSQGVRIGDRTWIGAGCTILDGSTLGADVIVTPGSVVSGDVPDRSIVQGNPAQTIFTRR